MILEHSPWSVYKPIKFCKLEIMINIQFLWESILMNRTIQAKMKTSLGQIYFFYYL